jgi:hypothetical protein
MHSRGGAPAPARRTARGNTTGASAPTADDTVITTGTDVDEWRAEGHAVDETSDMERSRLLHGWLAARRAVDHCLSDLLAAGPAGERRVREQLDLVDDLENRAHAAFDRYRSAAEGCEGPAPAASAAASAASAAATLTAARRPRLNVVRTADRPGAAETMPSTADSRTGS